MVADAWMPRVRGLFEVAPGQSLVIELEGARHTIVEASDAAARALGTTPEALVGRPLLEVAGDEERARAWRTALRAIGTDAAAALETSVDAVVSIDGTQRITRFNGAAERLFGYAKSEALGAPLELLLPERLRARHREHVARFADGVDGGRNMGQRTLPIRARRKDGEEFPAAATITRLELDGEATLTAILRDVTDDWRSEHEQRLLAELGAALASLDYDGSLRQVPRLAVRALADYAVLFVVDEAGELRRISAASSDPAQQWYADLMMELPDPAPPTHPVRRVVETRAPLLLHLDAASFEAIAQSPAHLEALRTAGPRSSVSVPLLAGGECVGVLGFSSATRLFDERDLRFAGEVGRRCALFVENVRLHRTEQRAVRSRDEVLGVVAHDLRNPLSAILVQATLLREVRDDHAAQAVVRGEKIARAAARMNRMIEDLLDVTRLEAGRFAVERAPLAPAPLLAAVADAQRPLVEARGLALVLELDGALPDLWTDRARLEQVFENLIGNATKFTARGSVTVGARADGEVVRFWVRDTGPGLGAEERQHAFDRFWQMRRSSRVGAGLGLTIVKGIVEAHGGRVWVESAEGGGSTFQFTLPCGRPA